MLELRVSTVSPLLDQRGPSAIARLIIPLVVDAVEREAFEPLAHVGQEVCKRAALFGIPTSTDRDTTAAVVGEPVVVGVATTLAHALPTLVGSSRPRPLPGRCLLGISLLPGSRACPTPVPVSTCPRPRSRAFFLRIGYSQRALVAGATKPLGHVGQMTANCAGSGWSRHRASLLARSF